MNIRQSEPLVEYILIMWKWLVDLKYNTQQQQQNHSMNKKNVFLIIYCIQWTHWFVRCSLNKVPDSFSMYEKICQINRNLLIYLFWFHTWNVNALKSLKRFKSYFEFFLNFWFAAYILNWFANNILSNNSAILELCTCSNFRLSLNCTFIYKTPPYNDNKHKQNKYTLRGNRTFYRQI